MIKLSEIESKYGEYLVDEDKLKELLVKPNPKKIWDLKIGENYYYINALGDICKTFLLGNEFDEARIEFCNAFLTEEEAKIESERKKCENIMLKYGRRTFKQEQANFSINYNHRNDCIDIAFWKESQYQGIIYFDSKKLAQIAIDEIGEDKIKKYVFRIEE